MAQRITHADLVGIVARLQRSLHRLDTIGPDDTLTFSVGSAYYGNSNTLEVTGLRGRNVFGHQHYGFTARELYDLVHAQCTALEDVPTPRRLYAVTACLEQGKQVPTFFLDVNVQGILSEAAAADIAHDIVPGASVCAVRV